jgi:hypothetical protein
MNDLIEIIIQKIPILIWPIVIGLSIYGLIIILQKMYGFVFTIKDHQLCAMKETLEFKEKEVLEYKNYISDLQEQLNLQKEVAQVSYKVVLNLNNELEEIKQKYRFALFTNMWMFERERFLRKTFMTLLANTDPPIVVIDYLKKHWAKMLSMIESNEKIYSELRNDNSKSIQEKIIECFPKHYLSLPISEEIDIFSKMSEDIWSIPSKENDVAVTNE